MKKSVYEPNTIGIIEDFMEVLSNAHSPNQIREILKLERYLTSKICVELIKSRIRELILVSTPYDIELYTEIIESVDEQVAYMEKFRNIVRLHVNSQPIAAKRVKEEKSADPEVVNIEVVNIEVVVKNKIVKSDVPMKNITEHMLRSAYTLFPNRRKSVAAYCGITLEELDYWNKFYLRSKKN